VRENSASGPVTTSSRPSGGCLHLVHQPEPLDRRDEPFRVVRSDPDLGGVEQRGLCEREVVLFEEGVRVPPHVGVDEDLVDVAVGVQRRLHVPGLDPERVGGAVDRGFALGLARDADGLRGLERRAPNALGRDRRARLEDALALDQGREPADELEVAAGLGGVGLQRRQRVVEVTAPLPDVGLEGPEHPRRERTVLAGRKARPVPAAGPRDAQEVFA